MRLLPLTLSAHPSAWFAGAGVSQRREGQRCSWRRAPPTAEFVTSDNPAECRFCGVRTVGRHEVFHLNGDHDDARRENLVSACALCHLCQHLDEAEAAEAATLIWLPEIAQAAVFVIIRGVHTVLADYHAAGGSTSRLRRLPPLAGVHRTLAALQAREEQAAQILGTTRPATLGAALLTLDPISYRERFSLLDGVRLLPTGKLMRDGRDIYPELLHQYARPAALPTSGSAA